MAANMATTFAMDDVPDYQSSSIMALQITLPGSDPIMSNVAPLTTSLGLNQSDLAREVSHQVFVWCDSASGLGGLTLSARPYLSWAI